ncbi:MAG: hypothetical protein IIU74_05965 [Ruminiclostridium sp.]|nr:hypothetical protein [Ruminiclostridium sp.]
MVQIPVPVFAVPIFSVDGTIETVAKVIQMFRCYINRAAKGADPIVVTEIQGILVCDTPGVPIPTVGFDLLLIGREVDCTAEEFSSGVI